MMPATVAKKYLPTKPVRANTAGGDYVVVRNFPVGAIAQGYENCSAHGCRRAAAKVRKAPSFWWQGMVRTGCCRPLGFTDICVPLEVSK